MPKNKHKRYERVRQLPNVIFPDFDDFETAGSYPWNHKPYQGMKKVLELGCGKGEHSLAFAAANADRLYIGIDSKSHRLCVGAETALDKGIENVLFLHARVEQIKDFFKDHTIHEIWLTFPDPHVKNRAVKHRLSADFFLDLYARLLVPEGTVFLKTDSNLLYTYTRESVEKWGGRIISVSDNIYRPDENPVLVQDAVSAFQKAALAKGATIKFMAFQLSSNTA